jgi:N-acetylmuramoyl-L-alanine amidase CwlA
MSYILNKKICLPGLKNNPNKKMDRIGYITIHNTGNYAAAATAKMHADYEYNGSGGSQTSWHYSVDNKEVWQSFEDTSMCWHAGNSIGNATSIGIEICVNDRPNFPAACDNAEQLVADLLKRHNLTIDKVVQHNYWSGKNCPAEIRAGTWGVTWSGFLSKVKDYLEETPRVKTPILSAPTASSDQMKIWAQNKKSAAFFIELAPTFYKIAVKSGVNPVAAYCQSAKETAYGKFGGVLDESYHNPCGLKVSAGGSDTNPDAHKRFDTWDEGIQAQIDHLALYAGAPGYPKPDSPDPRHFPFLLGTAKTVEELGGKWAPSPDYGSDIVKLMNEVSAIAPPALPEPDTDCLIVLIDEKEVTISAVLVDDYNYVLLREISDALGYDVAYDDVKKIPILSKKPV